MKNNGFLYTEDMRLAAYLLAKNVHLRKIVPSNVKEGMKVFVFEKTAQSRIERTRFLNGKAKVEPKVFMERYRDLRAIVRAEKAARQALDGCNGRSLRECERALTVADLLQEEEDLLRQAGFIVKDEREGNET